MLQFIRDKATGWIAWGIVILISIPFALWGISDYLGFGGGASVAEVNGTELSVNEYNLTYQRHRQRLAQMLGGSVDIRRLDEGLLREQSLETLIHDTLVVQYANDENLTIGDGQLARAIRSQQPFQLNGSFNQGLYDNWLRSQGMGPGGFEYYLRRSLLLEQVLSGVGGSAIATSAEKERIVALARQTRSYDELRIATANFKDIAVPEAEIAAYHSANPDTLQTEEVVTLAYARLSLNDLAAAVVPDEEALQAQYEASKLNYTQPERRRAAHILLRVASDANEHEVADALAATAELKAQLESGEDFATLAEAHSEDPGSAENGGDLGFFERGIMDPAFEEAVFDMSPNDVSDPVRTSFGFHLIELKEVVEGRTKTFEESRPEIVEAYQIRQAEQAYFEQVETMAELAFEVPDTLDVIAETLGLEVVTVDSVSRVGSLYDLVASDPAVVEAAFSPDVLLDGNNSDVIELPDNEVVVLRVVDHTPARTQTFDEARDSIVSRLRQGHAEAQAKATGENALTELRGGVSQQDIAAGVSASWQTRENVGRRDAAHPAEVRELVFSMSKPALGGTTSSGMVTTNGDYVLVLLREVTDGSLTAVQADDLNAVEVELLADYGRVSYDGFVNALRAQADIVVNEDTLSADSGY